jgi:hypothetical protein
MSTARFASIAVLAGLLGCGGNGGGGSGGAANAVAVSVHPQAVQIGTGGSMNFAAVTTGTANTAVTWSILEGAPAAGTITAVGTYSAPAVPGTYHVVAQSQADPSRSATATVTVVTLPPPPASAQACAAEPISSSGHTVYYACDCQLGADPNCVPGNDSNNGTSPTTPFQTYSKVRGKFSSLLAGDTIAFCQGGSFTNNGAGWTNTNCTATTPCNIRDYADPRWTAAIPAVRPVLNSAANTRGMDFSGGSVQGYRVLNIKLLAAGPGQDGFAIAGPGTGPATDITICNVEVNGYSQGIEFYQASPRLTVIGSRFVNNTHIAILGGANDTLIKDNYFDHNGSANPAPANQSHGGVYVSVHYDTDPRFPGGVTNMTITGNTMTNNTLVNGVCEGAPLVVHAAIDGLLLENNLIDGRGPSGVVNGTDNNGGCFGIMLGSGGYTQITYFRHVTFRRNRLLYTGNVGIATSECTNCVVEDNEIVLGYPGAGNDVSGIEVPHDLHRSMDPDINTGTIVQNNTIYIGAGSLGEGILFKNEGSGYVASSNAVYYGGSNTGGFDCFTVATPGQMLAMDHNSCYRPNAPGAPWTYLSSSATGYSLAGWTSASGFDGSSQQSDPLFKAIVEPWDFTPCLAGDPGCSGTSPLVGAADPAHFSPVAISGPTWEWTALDPGKTRDANPDIGAYER